MKIKKKAAISALIFSAAMNLNGCAYGPPPESNIGYGVYGPPSEIRVESSADTHTDITTKADTSEGITEDTSDAETTQEGSSENDQ